MTDVIARIIRAIVAVAAALTIYTIANGCNTHRDTRGQVTESKPEHLSIEKMSGAFTSVGTIYRVLDVETRTLCYVVMGPNSRGISCIPAIHHNLAGFGAERE